MSEEEMGMDPELRELLRSGAPKLAAPPGAEARVFAALTATLAPLSPPGEGNAIDAGSGGGAGAPSGAPAAAGAASVGSSVAGTMSIAKAAALAALTFAAGGATGAAIVKATAPAPQVVYIDRAVPDARASAAPPESSVAEPEASSPVEAPSATPSGTAKPVAKSPSSGLVEERTLLDEARVAFMQGDWARALTALDRHEKRYSQGQLAEEREALRIRVLAESGRKTEATERSSKFRTRYPDSLLGPAVEAAVDAGP